MKFAYYPGCYLHGTALEYDMSTRAVCRKLGIELIELDDWNCCGAVEANNSLSIPLSARNLALAERMGLNIVAPCSVCFHKLSKANKMVKGDEKFRKKINEMIDGQYQGGVEVRHLLDIIVNEVGLERVSKDVKVPLEGVKAVPYYGCLIVRPSEIAKFDDPEDPQSLDDLIKATGAECLPYSHKVSCCGGGLLANKEDFALDMAKKIIDSAKRAGSNCIVVTCPLCHTMLDFQQSNIGSRYGITIDLPVLYFTQLLGLALGLGVKELGLDKNIVSPMKLLESIGIG
ncbi:MAG: CoB--CoM heterodisulfide reductase iron-sulfur subunit B family protein [Methanocellales archaeon]|nr:CoB--CoM heterodisulfide reductase iron-sulfur subunit B family protein [Methanocellales archaeon]